MFDVRHADPPLPRGANSPWQNCGTGAKAGGTTGETPMPQLGVFKPLFSLSPRAAKDQVHGEALARRLFRKFSIRTSELHLCAKDVKMAFVAMRTIDHWRALLDRWYDDEDAYGPLVRRPRPGSLVAAGGPDEP